MNPENIFLSGINQVQREKNSMSSLTCGILKSRTHIRKEAILVKGYKILVS
jgi:hypothetical protein